MTEKEFLDKYHIDVPIYEQYGNYIKDRNSQKS